jgi:hypothetical protein
MSHEDVKCPDNRSLHIPAISGVFLEPLAVLFGGHIMRLIFALGALAATVTATAVNLPAHASGVAKASLHETTIPSDVSAQKKKKVVNGRHTNGRHWQRNAGYRTYGGDPTKSPYYLRPGVAPSFGYIGPPGYAGEYAWRRSIGQCVEDLGYGRWAACGSR